MIPRSVLLNQTLKFVRRSVFGFVCSSVCGDGSPNRKPVRRVGQKVLDLGKDRATAGKGFCAGARHTSLKLLVQAANAATGFNTWPRQYLAHGR